MTDTARCTIHFGETFSQHVNRCNCEIPATTWATMRHTDHLANLEPATGEGTVEQVADQIADALVDTHLSLLRLEWLTNQAQSGDLRSLEDQARIAFTAARARPPPARP